MEGQELMEEKRIYGVMDQMTVGVDELAMAVAFVQHWTGRSAAKAGNPVPDELMDTVAQACAFNMSIEPVGFTTAVAKARADLAKAVRAQEAQVAQNQPAPEAAAGFEPEPETVAGFEPEPEFESEPKRPYNPADYDEEDPFGTSFSGNYGGYGGGFGGGYGGGFDGGFGGGDPAFDFAAGGHLDECSEENCASCRFANEHCYANENLGL